MVKLEIGNSLLVIRYWLFVIWNWEFGNLEIVIGYWLIGKWEFIEKFKQKPRRSQTAGF
jgi:hypothetical protein